MLDIVQLPLARRMWRISKLFNLPLNDERIQDLSIYDIEFYEYSKIADDPKKLEELQNHFYDDEYDAWVEEFETEMELEQQKAQENKVSMPDEETIRYAEKTRKMSNSDTENDGFDDDYEVSENTEISDWEEVE